MARRSSSKPEPLRLVSRRAAEPQGEELDHPARWARPHVRTIAITSGKGGIGSSHLAVNLAVALGQRGARVLLVDADLGEPSLDLLLGLHPRYDLQHWACGEKDLDDLVIAGPAGVRLVPGGAGAPELADLDDYRRECLLRGLGQLEGDVDLILLDTASGLTRQGTAFSLAADEAVVLTTPEMPAFADAYALVKLLAQRGITRPPGLVVSMAASPEEAEETAHRIKVVARRFLEMDLEPWGAVPLDPAVPGAARLQEPVVTAFPDSPAAGAYRAMAARVWPAGPDDSTHAGRPEAPLRLEA
jgi:flagellar biosynthesis protein FlhG